MPKKDFDIDKIDASPYPERVLLAVALTCSLVSIVMTWWIWAAQTLSPRTLLVHDDFVFISLLILTGFFFLRYRQVLNSKKAYQLTASEQLKSIRELIRLQIQIYHSLMRKTKVALYQEAGSEIDIYRHRFNYRKSSLNELLDHSLSSVISELLKILQHQLRSRDIQEELSISVKARVTGLMARSMIGVNSGIADIEDEELCVITLDRDHFTKVNHPEREVRRAGYKLTQNSDFVEIIYHESEYFMSNDLLTLAKYKNANAEWSKRYRAALVVPISYQELVPRSERYVYGFLTVDSMNGGHHEHLFNAETLSILSFGAELLALIFLYLEISDRLPSGD